MRGAAAPRMSAARGALARTSNENSRHTRTTGLSHQWCRHPPSCIRPATQPTSVVAGRLSDTGPAKIPPTAARLSVASSTVSTWGSARPTGGIAGPTTFTEFELPPAVLSRLPSLVLAAPPNSTTEARCTPAESCHPRAAPAGVQLSRRREPPASWHQRPVVSSVAPHLPMYGAAPQRTQSPSLWMSPRGASMTRRRPPIPGTGGCRGVGQPSDVPGLVERFNVTP
jgi:hypothetical protein